jgi:hypothetical protein
MQDVRDALGIKIESPYWDEAYKKALSEPLIPEWLTEEYIRSIHEKYGFFKKNLEVIVSAAPHIVKVPELCILAKTLYHIIGLEKAKLAGPAEVYHSTIGISRIYLRQSTVKIGLGKAVIKFYGTGIVHYGRFEIIEFCRHVGTIKPRLGKRRLHLYDTVEVGLHKTVVNIGQRRQLLNCRHDTRLGPIQAGNLEQTVTHKCTYEIIFPSIAIAQPTLEQVVVLPLPPLLFAKQMVFVIAIAYILFIDLSNR